MKHSKLLSSLATVSRLRWLKAVREALLLLFPITFISAIVMLLGSFPYASVFPSLVAHTGNTWKYVSDTACYASYGVMSISLVVLISHILASDLRDRCRLEISQLMIASLALANFFLFIDFSAMQVNHMLLGPRSALLAIIVAILSVEILFLLARLRFLSPQPADYNFDPQLHQATRYIAPFIATFAVFLAAKYALAAISIDPAKWICDLLLALNALDNSQLLGLTAIGLINHLLWFFGIHGTHVLESISPLLFADSGTSKHVFDFSRTFFSLYVHIGGSGATMGLLLAFLFQARHRDTRRVGKLALIPAIFNINEVIIYGLPIVFNPFYLIPFLLAPLLQIVLSYFCVRSGLIVLDVTEVPWMMPPILAGTINSGSVAGGILQCANIALSALIYTPFVRLAERQKEIENLKNFGAATSEIQVLLSSQQRVLKRWVGRSRYAEKVHLTAPRIILHDHALAYEGVILHNFVEIRQHEHIIINTL